MGTPGPGWTRKPSPWLNNRSTDAAGRYCLNDLHKASGGKSLDQPSYFFTNKKTAEMVAELSAECSRNSGITPTNIVRGNFSSGVAQGTYVVKELVYAYAMWISPAFWGNPPGSGARSPNRQR